MSALENVFGKGVKLDAAGNPIERGFGNLTQQAADAAAAAAKVQKPIAINILAQAKIQAEKLIADAKAEAAKIAADALAAAAAAPATVASVGSPNVAAVPPAAAATIPPPEQPPAVTSSEAAPANQHPSVLEQVRAALAKGEANLESEIENLVKDL